MSSAESTTDVRSVLLNRLSQFPNAHRCWELTRDSPRHPVEFIKSVPGYNMSENPNNESHSFVTIDGQLNPASLHTENHLGMHIYCLMGGISVPIHGREMSFVDACANPNITTTNCVSSVGDSHLIGFWDAKATRDTVPSTKYLARAILRDGTLAKVAHAWATDNDGNPHTPRPNSARFPIGAFAYELSIRSRYDIPFERKLYGGKVATDVMEFAKCLNEDLTDVFVFHASPPESSS